MREAQTQDQQSLLSDRIRERLASLDVTVVELSRDRTQTTAAAQGDPRWIERLLVDSPAFARRAGHLWPQLSDGGEHAVMIWPGVWLVPLTAQRRRRATDESRSENLLAALLVGPQWLESDQLHQICDARQFDFAAAVSRADRSTLVTDIEAQRLACMLSWMRQDSLDIDRHTGEIGGLSNELSESYEELSLLYKLATNMTVDQPPTTFLQEACRELHQVVGLRFLSLQLIDDDPRLNVLSNKIFTAGNIRVSSEQLRAIGSTLLARGMDKSTPMIADDTAILGISDLPELSRDLLVVPLFTEQRVLGVMFAGEKLDGSEIDAIDAKLCSALANSLSIFIENVMLYDDMQAMFLGTLHALTAAIDAKDSYTHGHSERVAMMSRQLAKAAGLSEHDVERVYISGLVHDVGKIGVPEAVLGKPGRLTDEEFDLIKMHPEVGAKILQDIRQMHDLIPGVLYHHERWDGKGYPHKLSGEDIPMFGRLICLADSFDAMSSNRTYRKGMSHEQVIDEIRRCAGTQFDPVLAQEFVNLDFTRYWKMIEKHQNLLVKQSA